MPENVREKLKYDGPTAQRLGSLLKKQKSRFLSPEEEDETVENLVTSVEKEPPRFVSPKEPSISVPEVRSPEAIQEKKKIQRIITNTDYSDPKEFDKTMRQINKISAELPKEVKRQLEEKRTKIERAAEIAQQEYRRTKDWNKYAKIAETLGQALSQWAAAAYGLKHGVDMSGLKFNKTDWTKNIDRAEGELDRKLKRLQKQEQQVGKVEEQARKRVEDITDFQKEAILKNFFEQRRQQIKDRKEADKVAKSLAKQEEKEQTEKTKRQERAELAKARSLLQKYKDNTKMLNKALAEAQAARAGEGNASFDKVSKMLGGERGNIFRGVLEEADEDTAVRYLQATLKQTKLGQQAIEQRLQDVLKGQLSEAESSNESIRTIGGKKAVFDSQTKQFLRWAE